MKYTIEDVHDILERNSIEHEIEDCNGFKFIYCHHGDFGRPSGVKFKKNEFRPDFRITVHDEDPAELVYTKVCGYTSYMTMEEVLNILKGETA